MLILKQPGVVETKKTYVSKLEDCIDGYMAEMHKSSNLPDVLKAKEKLVFGNIKFLCSFHRDTFLATFQNAKTSLRALLAAS